MRRLVLAFTLWIIICSCNNTETTEDKQTNKQPEKNNQSNPSAASPDEKDFSGCYMQVLQRDTFAAKLLQQGNTITGKLTFDNYQKDGSSGTVKGSVDNNIIKLVYSFQSEGMNSVMDVYFKADDNSLIQGIGEMKTKGDTAYFSNPAAVDFPEKDKLTKLSCSELPEKYQ